MKTIKFKDVNQDKLFIWNGAEYQKILEEKVSCCKSINAVKYDNKKIIVQILPNTEVQIKDEL